MNKSYVFKSNVAIDDIMSLFEPAIEEYINYYNRTSDFICDNLTSMKIGDLANYIKNKENVYCKFVLNDDIKDLPLYKIFSLNLNSSQKKNADNALYEAIKVLNADGYKGKNILGLGDTYFRRNGYVKNVISNYRTKFVTLKPNVKYSKIDINSVTEQLIKTQTIFEVVNKKIESETDFENLITYFKNRETPNDEKIKRLELLFDYYTKHKNEINEEIEKHAVESLKSFNGCRRNGNRKTMTVQMQKMLLKKHGLTSYILHLVLDKKPYDINLMGNRQTVKVDNNGNRVDLVDISSKHGYDLTFEVKGKTLFFTFSSEKDFSKKEQEIKNILGIDINTKHSMLATSITDNGKVKGYINIYVELLKNKDFVSTLNKEELAYYTEMAKFVSFGLLEIPSLFERVSNQYDKKNNVSITDETLLKREIAISQTLDNLAKKYRDKNCKIASYIDYTKMLRSKYKSYFILKQKYYEKNHEYDDKMGFSDISTNSKETMDPRRFENPFINTDIAKGLIVKLENVKCDIVGCRDNIIKYAYDVIVLNGFDTIGLEYLDSSNFERDRLPFPTAKSLMTYYGFEGKKYSEIDKSVFNTKYYNFIFNENETIKDISYSVYGLKEIQKKRFKNLVIKAIGFADIKDKFVQLSNNTNMNVIFVPAAFTSQMDSNTHKIYVKEIMDKNNKKQLQLIDKRKVRTKQEFHINGLNADFNAANNIKYIAENNDLLLTMCTKTKENNRYGNPLYNIKDTFKKKIPSSILNIFKKKDMYQIICD